MFLDGSAHVYSLSLSLFLFSLCLYFVLSYGYRCLEGVGVTCFDAIVTIWGAGGYLCIVFFGSHGVERGFLPNYQSV